MEKKKQVILALFVVCCHARGYGVVCWVHTLPSGSIAMSVVWCQFMSGLMEYIGIFYGALYLFHVYGKLQVSTIIPEILKLFHYF